jgi:hypothetical protein
MKYGEPRYTKDHALPNRSDLVLTGLFKFRQKNPQFAKFVGMMPAQISADSSVLEKKVRIPGADRKIELVTAEVSRRLAR